MRFDVLTLFPAMFEGPLSESILKRANDKGITKYFVHDLRDWAEDKHKTVDRPPYGGGPGMVMQVDVIDRAITDIKRENPEARVILMDTKGTIYDQQIAKRLKSEKGIILICGHYEGLDHRVHEHLVDEVISIGEFVLTGGELPAMMIIDSVTRLLDGVVGNPDSLNEESYEDDSTQEYPQYTRPEEYKGWRVPDVLLSGNHAQIKKWREEMKK
jgi:tRNA (guanine37-N1)-methyltransferase